MSKNQQQIKMENNKKEQVKTAEMVVVCKTSYHYYRNWIRDILTGAGAKFNNEKEG